MSIIVYISKIINTLGRGDPGIGIGLRIIHEYTAAVVIILRFEGVGGTNGVKGHVRAHRVAAPVDDLY